MTTGPQTPLRIATAADIGGIQRVRHSVRENVLSDPARVTDEDCRVMLEERGRGWVWEESGAIVAFGIADAESRNVWALFVEPGFDGRGIGSQLLATMTEWLRSRGDSRIWLTTSPGTRAERFYAGRGWVPTGTTPDGEVRFELDLTD